MKNKPVFLVFLALFFIKIHFVYSQNNQTNNNHIDSLIIKKKRYNKKYGYGFRIQLFNGNETTARDIKSIFLSKYPNTPIYIKYENPEWKIQIGNYRTRLEADRFLKSLKNEFTGAIVISL